MVCCTFNCCMKPRLGSNPTRSETYTWFVSAPFVSTMRATCLSDNRRYLTETSRSYRLCFCLFHRPFTEMETCMCLTTNPFGVQHFSLCTEHVSYLTSRSSSLFESSFSTEEMDLLLTVVTYYFFFIIFSRPLSSSLICFVSSSLL